MSHSHRLAKIAKSHGMTIAQLVAQALAESNGNEFRAAIALGVYPNTIRYHRTGQAKKRQTAVTQAK